ncbi:MAG TPA: NAD-dependent epimerase/dehydratase family protein [Polyangia bacterium]|jgi:CDP-paratose 2-epimerase
MRYPLPFGDGPVVISGGAGFIGSNVADRLLLEGQPVVILDNLSRGNVAANLEWLRGRHGARLAVEIGDVRDAPVVERVVRRAAAVFHYAAQVAVTTSLVAPIEDFEINARGTLNLLEAIRRRETPPPLVFTSTNKVYGRLDDVELGLRGSRYEPRDPAVRKHGLGEQRPLDFHSPYGCSKGAADQYVLDYARTFGLPAAVLRMSCIYGPRQFGTEDQGWVAHFLIRARDHEPVVIYGDGRQVRDILFIDDLVEAMLAAQASLGQIAGRAFNIGGGPANTISLLELLDLIGDLAGARPEVRFEPWRTADQRYYVSDVREFRAATGWSPRVRVRDGVARLREWLAQAPRLAPAAAVRSAS